MAVNQLQVIEIPCGAGGLNYSRAVSGFPITDLRYCENLTFEDDTWQKEGGADKINDTAITDGPTIVGLHDFWVSSTSQKTIAATSDGKIVTVDSGGIDATLKTGLGSTKLTVFVEALGTSSTRKLFAFNGYNTVQVTSDGASCSDIDNGAADWSGTDQPDAGVIHRGRLWAWGGAYPHQVYYSQLTDHEDFQDTGSGNLNIYPGEGEKIVAGISFAGRLFLWKYPRGIYWVDDSDTDVTNWSASRLTTAVGMSGPRGLSQTDNDVLFISSEGLIHSLATVQEYGDAKASSIFPDKIGGFVREKINLERIGWATAVYYPHKKQWHLAHSGKGYTYNNQRLILDLHDMNNVRYSYSPRDECESMTLRRDSDGLERPIIGDRAGYLRYLDESNRNKDGAGYTGKFETADVEIFPGGIRRGNLQWVQTIFRPQGNHNLTLDVYLDGEYSETLSINMGSTGAALGSFTLGTSTLGGGDIKNVTKLIHGDPRRIKFIGYNSGGNESFSISSFLVGFYPGNERVDT